MVVLSYLVHGVSEFEVFARCDSAISFSQVLLEEMVKVVLRRLHTALAAVLTAEIARSDTPMLLFSCHGALVLAAWFLGAMAWATTAARGVGGSKQAVAVSLGMQARVIPALAHAASILFASTGSEGICSAH